jgi:hypothetical protein
MTIYEGLVDQRCYTFASWVSKEKPQTRTKAQGLLNTTKVERVHCVLMPHTSRSTTSIQMDADHRKTGRKILDLQSRKARTEHMIPKETTTTPEAAIQVEVMAGVEAKIDIYLACFMRATQTIRQQIAPSS